MKSPRCAPALALSLAALAVLSGCSNRAAERTDSAEVARGADAAPAAGDSATMVFPGYAPAVMPIGAEEILERVKTGSNATLVNLWATWCAPCRHEMPALLKVARAHRGDGLRLMLVSADFDDQIGAVRRFLATHAVDETTFIKAGSDNEFINALHSEWSGALPATLVFDRHGRLTDFWEGAADENRFSHAVIAALTERSQTEVTK